MYVAMYINIASVNIYLLCMIKVRVRWCTCSLWRMLAITLGKLIGLLFSFCHPLLSIIYVFENSKNKRNDLARPAMGTIFRVLLTFLLEYMHINYFSLCIHTLNMDKLMYRMKNCS